MNLNNVDSSWRPLLNTAISTMDANYLRSLKQNFEWLPGPDTIFNAFTTQPLSKVKYILFGESPYPRSESANGYAFWDNAVETIWSDRGFSKAVNRATSLRNFLKMLLIARGDLKASDTSQPAIASVNKSKLIQHLPDLFQGLQQHGFLLLNACLVLSDKKVSQEAKFWHPFIVSLLKHIALSSRSDITLVLFGKIAEKISPIADTLPFQTFIAEHPYNVSFITNPKVLNFFQPFDLLRTNANIKS